MEQTNLLVDLFQYVYDDPLLSHFLLFNFIFTYFKANFYQSTITYSDRTIQRRPRPGAIPTKFPHKPLNRRDFSKQPEERLIAKKKFVFY